jgi:hypothetical protein
MMRRLALGLLALAAGLGAPVAADRALDHYQHWRITQDIQAWEAASLVADDRRLATHIATLDALIDAHPGHPALRFTMVKLYEWRAHLQRYSPRHAAASLLEAERHLREAVSLRPQWGRAWAAWLETGARLDNHWRAELQQRLDNALALGRYDLHTQHYLTEFALRQWPHLPPEVQQRFRPVLDEIHQRGGPLSRRTELFQRAWPTDPQTL